MKKLFIGMVVSVLVISCLGLIACGGIDFGGNSSSNDTETETTITVYNGETPVEFTVKLGQRAEVRAFTKSGYYLTGYFTEKEGGEKYFETNGLSVGKWQEGNPTTFYAQWASIEGLSVSCTFATDEPLGVFTAFGSAKSVQCKLNNVMQNAVNGNLDKKIKIKLSARVYYTASGALADTKKDTCSIYIMNSTSSSAEKYGKTKIEVPGNGEYNTYTLNFEVPASCAKNGSFYVTFDRGNVLDGTLYFKDITCSASF